SPVRESVNATLSFLGPGSALAAAYFSVDQDPGIPEFAFVGALVADPSTEKALFFGPLSPVGGLQVNLVAPNLPPTVLGAVVYAQSFFFDAGITHVSIGPASAVVVLDSSL